MPTDAVAPNGPGRKDPVASIAGQMESLSSGARARLRRMDPDRPGRAMGDIIPLLLDARVPPPDWRTDGGLRRWARVCHLIATISGAGGRAAHAPAFERGAHGEEGKRFPQRETGRAIHAARLSELRLLRLTSARGPALAAQVARLSRYIATSGVAPLDLWPIANLLLHDGRNDARAETARLTIARSYYAAMADADRKDSSEQSEEDS